MYVLFDILYQYIYLIINLMNVLHFYFLFKVITYCTYLVNLSIRNPVMDSHIVLRSRVYQYTSPTYMIVQDTNGDENMIILLHYDSDLIMRV